MKASGSKKVLNKGKRIKGKSNHALAHAPDELGEALGLSKGDIGLMKYKADLSKVATESIRQSGITVNEIVKLSGVARSKVSAVKNGATISVSCDLLVKIITAIGTSVRVKAA